MNYRNITNHDIVNLENCEDEPIHIPGLIQPHGFLLSIDSKSDIINVCSENIKDFLELTYQKALGHAISNVFDANLTTAYQLFKSEKNALQKETHLSIQEKHFSISFHYVYVLINDFSIVRRSFSELFHVVYTVPLFFCI